MTYRAVHAEDRLEQPARNGRETGPTPVPWPEVLAALADLPRGGLLVVSPLQTVEEMALARELAEARGMTVVSGPAEALRGEGDDLLLDADRAPNRAGLAAVGIPELPAAELADRLRDTNGPVVVYGGDPLAALDGDRFRVDVYLGTHAGASSAAADLVVPLWSWAEKDGLLVNRHGRWQALHRAVVAPGTAREDWRVLAEWLQASGGDPAAADLASLRRRLAGRLGLDDPDTLLRLPPDGWQPAADTTAAGGER